MIGLPGAGNLVVANQNNGIEISPEADFNAVSGNAVGTTLASGSFIGIGPPVNLGNESNGIFLNDASANTIGGADQIDAKGNITLLGGNVVSSNGQAGIDVSGNDPFLPGNQGNVILGNLVGTRAGGSGTVGNASTGIELDNSAKNTIGGVNGLNPDGSLSSFNGNLVSGNVSYGLQFNNTLTAGNLAIGNRIGTDLSGTRALPNADDGVLITFGASNNTIGAANLDGSAANLISGNALERHRHPGHGHRQPSTGQQGRPDGEWDGHTAQPRRRHRAQRGRQPDRRDSTRSRQYHLRQPGIGREAHKLAAVAS